MKIFKKIKPDFIDKRGLIIRPINDTVKEKIRSISLIASKAGMIRGNHYHKKEAHFAYVIYGKVEYYGRMVKGKKIMRALLGEGDMVYTPVNEIHAMRFYTRSALLYFSTEHRTKAGDLGDTFKIVIAK